MLIMAENTTPALLGRPLPEIVLPELCLGGYQFTDKWNNTPEDQIVRLVQMAIDGGIMAIDTSEMHGTEEVIGRAIKGREGVIVVSKAGLMEDPDRPGNWMVDASPSNISRGIDASLHRLGNVERIDVFMSHWPDPNVPVEDTVGALSEAQTAGKIGRFGLSNYPGSDIRRARAVAPGLSVFQGHYSLLDRTAEDDILPQCSQAPVEHPLDLMAYRVLGRGLLTGKHRPGDAVPDGRAYKYEMFKEPHLSQILQNVQTTLREVAHAYRRTPSQVAIRWVLEQGATTALAGVSTEHQLEELIGAQGWKLEKSDVDYLGSVFSRDQEYLK